MSQEDICPEMVNFYSTKAGHSFLWMSSLVVNDNQTSFEMKGLKLGFHGSFNLPPFSKPKVILMIGEYVSFGHLSAQT